MINRQLSPCGKFFTVTESGDFRPSAHHGNAMAAPKPPCSFMSPAGLIPLATRDEAGQITWLKRVNPDLRAAIEAAP